MSILTDPYLWGSILLWIGVVRYYGDPLGKKMDHWERGLLSMIEVPVFVTVTYLLLNLVGITGFRVEVLDLTGLSLFGGLMYAVRWLPAFNYKLGEMDFGDYRSLIRTANFFIPVTFGIAMGTFVHMTHPDATILDTIYGYHMILAIEILQSLQAVVGILVVSVAPTVTAFVAIFKNNLIFAAKTAAIGAVGGLSGGVLLPTIMVMVVHGGLLLGLVPGILMRNSIAAGSPVLGPPFALLTGFGALIAGHTMWEYIGALAVAGAGGAGVAYGISRGRRDYAIAGVKVLTLAVSLVFIAGVIEVTYDPFIVKWTRGYVTIEPVLNRITVDSSWFVALAMAFASSLGVLRMTTWTTQKWDNYV